MRTYLYLLVGILFASSANAQIISNPVLTTFRPYPTSGYVTAPARVPTAGMRGYMRQSYAPVTAIGQSSRPVMTYRVPVTRYYAAPARVTRYQAVVVPAQTVYRIPVTGPPTAIIRYYQPVRTAGMPPAYMPAPAAPVAPPVTSGYGCGGR